MKRQKTRSKKLITENDTMQTEDTKGNLEVFLIVTTLLMLAETQSFKLQKLLLE